MRKLKLLIIGSDMVWAIEKYYQKHLAGLGMEVELFPVQNIFYNYLGRSIFNRILFRLGLSGIHKRLNGMLKQRFRSFGPDVIWVIKGMEVLPRTLEWFRNEGVELVNYNPDNPFLFSGRGSGNSNVTSGMKFYDLHLSYDRDIAARITREYGIRTALLPFGYELDPMAFDSIADETEELRVCFIGNLDKDRQSYISHLASEGLGVDVYGHNEGFRLDSPNIRFFPAVYGMDFWKTLRKYRVQLNLMRIHNTGSHNMRSFEVPGAGGIGLFPDTDDHRTYFRDGEHVFLFSGMSDMVSKARYILQLPDEEAKGIRRNARMFSEQQGYSYKSRSLFLSQLFREISDKPVQ